MWRYLIWSLRRGCSLANVARFLVRNFWWERKLARFYQQEYGPPLFSWTHRKRGGVHFDKFNVPKILNEAVDKVRREEQGLRPELKKTRYIWLKNPINLKEREVSVLESHQLKKLHLKAMKAYNIRLNIQEIWNQEAQDAEIYLKKLHFWSTHSRLEQIKKTTYAIKRHWTGILRWFKSKINNGILEAINSLIQTTKAQARGYRTTKSLISIISCPES